MERDVTWRTVACGLDGDTDFDLRKDYNKTASFQQYKASSNRHTSPAIETFST
jgi:hypothetical protein